MKAVAVYATPFWRAAGWSGFGASQLGPLGEIHDASPPTGPLGALFGFLAPLHPLRHAPLAQRPAAMVQQLGRLSDRPPAVRWPTTSSTGPGPKHPPANGAGWMGPLSPGNGRLRRCWTSCSSGGIKLVLGKRVV
ncbi:hypothetical protein [Hymenobacter roseosalivarius]|nr:hypothetical protein [Hymenobacter roseosalivarius]